MVDVKPWRLISALLALALVIAGCASTVGDARSDTEIVDQHGQLVAVEEEEVADGTLVLASPEEIGHGLLGNTIIGNWLGEDYRQFFDQSGATTYRPIDSGRDSVGSWRINVGTGNYESLWNEQVGWEEYEVHRDGDTWFWTGGGVELSSFTIVEGNQLTG